MPNVEEAIQIKHVINQQPDKFPFQDKLPDLSFTIEAQIWPLNDNPAITLIRALKWLGQSSLEIYVSQRIPTFVPIQLAYIKAIASSLTWT